MTRAIAFYLPQFHPIPENDAWWGEGFTEWTNVRRGEPVFPGHYQPHKPGELGYYDLRDPQVRQKQARLARDHSLSGFCYYHYWFNGHRLLERPFAEVLESGSPDFPFCLCWANEPWTRNWDGGRRKMLQAQTYSTDDDLAHIRWLLRAFEDERYIRIGGKPLFLVYRLSALPDPARTAEIWRTEAHKAGVGELFLCRVESFPNEHSDPGKFGFDAAVEFQPDWKNLPILRKVLRTISVEFRWRYDDVYNYFAFSRRMMRKPNPSYLRFPCVTPGWDNSVRRRTLGTILHDSHPDHYRKWLRSAVERVAGFPEESQLVFINAWNEWGEGCHLEPDQRWGRAYLEATQITLSASR